MNETNRLAEADYELPGDALNGMDPDELTEHAIEFTARHGGGSAYVAAIAARISDALYGAEHPDTIEADIAEAGERARIVRRGS